MDFEEAVNAIGRVGEAAGIAVIVIGVAVASVRFLRDVRRIDGGAAYRRYREGLGRALLLGLEFLVAADIIRTVATDPTLENVAVLAAIVLIRTFLSVALELEIEGRWPWQSPAERRRDRSPVSDETNR